MEMVNLKIYPPQKIKEKEERKPYIHPSLQCHIYGQDTQYSYRHQMCGHNSSEDDTVPYRPVYTVPASALVRVPPLFRTGKNTGLTG